MQLIADLPVVYRPEVYRRSLLNGLLQPNRQLLLQGERRAYAIVRTLGAAAVSFAQTHVSLERVRLWPRMVVESCFRACSHREGPNS